MKAPLVKAEAQDFKGRKSILSGRDRCHGIARVIIYIPMPLPVVPSATAAGLL